MTLADETVLMRGVRIVQCGSPKEAYESLSKGSSGWMLGNLGMNFTPHNMDKGRLLVPLLGAPIQADTNEQEVSVDVVCPWPVQVLRQPQEDAVKALVTHYGGVISRQHLLTFDCDRQKLKAKTLPSDVGAGQEKWVQVPPESVTLFNKDGQWLEASLA